MRPDEVVVASPGLDDGDCLVVDRNWTLKGEKGHARYYYQSGVGLVRIDVVKPDGSLDKGSSIELINP